MKQVFTFLFLLLAFITFGQEGIAFHATSWEDAVQLAKAEDKLIFVDAYTTWCAPCKNMEEYVFTQPQAGDFFNDRFINLHLDMEKGTGPIIGAQHGVRSYPTFLFLTWDGTLIHHRAGYHDVFELIDLGKAADQPGRVSLALDRRFDEGDRGPDLLYHLTMDRIDRGQDNYKELIPEYLKAQRDWASKDGMNYIFRFVEDVDSDMFRHMVNHSFDYAEVVGDEAYNEKFNQIVHRALNPSGREISLEERSKIYEIAYPNSAERLMIDYRMTYYAEQGDDANYSAAVYDYLMDFGSDDEEQLRKDIDLMASYLHTPEQQAQITTWYKDIAISDGNSDALIALGQRYVSMGKFDKAAALKKDIKDLLKKEGKPKSTLKAYLKAIKAAKKAVA